MPTDHGGVAKGTSSSSILVYLDRVSPSDDIGYPRDSWHHFLRGQTGSDGTLGDLEKKWLDQRITALGGTPGGGWNDRWGKYLTLNPSLAGQTGNLDDKFNAWIDHGAI